MHHISLNIRQQSCCHWGIQRKNPGSLENAMPQWPLSFCMAICEKNVLYIQAYMVFYIKIHKNLVLFHKLILQHFDKSSNYVNSVSYFVLVHWSRGQCTCLLTHDVVLNDACLLLQFCYQLTCMFFHEVQLFCFASICSLQLHNPLNQHLPIWFQWMTCLSVNVKTSV